MPGPDSIHGRGLAILLTGIASTIKVLHRQQPEANLAEVFVDSVEMNMQFLVAQYDQPEPSQILEEHDVLVAWAIFEMLKTEIANSANSP